MADPPEVWLMQLNTEPPFNKGQHIARIIAGEAATVWLRSFDPDGDGGRGAIVTTYVKGRAMRFPSFEAVMECWKTQSKVIPLRGDGKPNRPLTAFTIQPVKVKRETS